MRIDDRVVAEHMPRLDLDPGQVGWFSARQPGVLGFLHDWLSSRDGLAVAVEGAWRMCELVAACGGAQPPRLDRARLDRAAEAVVAEAAGRRASRLLARQPALARWLDEWLASPPTPLDAAESREVALVLAAVLFALDEAAIGRPIPAIPAAQ